jgi:hypothetical protein
VVLHEEDRAIVHLPFTDASEIHQIGRKYVLFKGEDEAEVFSFELAFDPVVRCLLEVAHIALRPENYATMILSLSDSNPLVNCEEFIPVFIDLLAGLEEEPVLLSFLQSAHLLYQDTLIQKGKACEVHKMRSLLFSLSKPLNLAGHVLVYACQHSEVVSEDYGLVSSQFPELSDVLLWCSHCLTGSSVAQFDCFLPLSRKLGKVFGLLNLLKDVCDVVVSAKRAKLMLTEIDQLHPMLSLPLRPAFALTAADLPDN